MPSAKPCRCSSTDTRAGPRPAEPEGPESTAAPAPARRAARESEPDRPDQPDGNHSMPPRSRSEFSRPALARRTLRRRVMRRVAELRGSEHPTHLPDEHAWQARLAEKSVTDRFDSALLLRV